MSLVSSLPVKGITICLTHSAFRQHTYEIQFLMRFHLCKLMAKLVFYDFLISSGNHGFRFLMQCDLFLSVHYLFLSLHDLFRFCFVCLCFNVICFFTIYECMFNKFINFCLLELICMADTDIIGFQMQYF